MGRSHDNMVTLENRVRGFERIVKDMAQDLTVSSGRKGSTFMVGYEGSSPDWLARVRGRDSSRRCDVFDAWRSYAYVSSGNGHISSRRALGGDDRSSREEHDSDQVVNTRSVWQALKDEATLEAIRVAGEDNETS
uniref:Uncharacterized protein n=1 Tax=Nelumbo nucifera TaxID=4432 RepID=A0A822YV08_NELNU|nr:TPA_asm: hypothetical protein HUJ06_006051 [Nelumbo nucifera]